MRPVTWFWLAKLRPTHAAWKTTGKGRLGAFYIQSNIFESRSMHVIGSGEDMKTDLETEMCLSRNQQRHEYHGIDKDVSLLRSATLLTIS